MLNILYLKPTVWGRDPHKANKGLNSILLLISYFISEFYLNIHRLYMGNCIFK